jgi:hypothetical protein
MLRIKQFHLNKLMNLKAKGRYLEETKVFSREVGIIPSF